MRSAEYTLPVGAVTHFRNLLAQAVARAKPDRNLPQAICTDDRLAKLPHPCLGISVCRTILLGPQEVQTGSAEGCKIKDFLPIVCVGAGVIPWLPAFVNALCLEHQHEAFNRAP